MTAFIVASLIAPLLYGVAGLVLELVDLLVPAPDLIGAIFERLDRTIEALQGVAAHLVASPCNGDGRNGDRSGMVTALFALLAGMATGFSHTPLLRVLGHLLIAATRPSPARTRRLLAGLAGLFASDGPVLSDYPDCPDCPDPDYPDPDYPDLRQRLEAPASLGRTSGSTQNRERCRTSWPSWLPCSP